jgi:hypothetical protein
VGWADNMRHLQLVYSSIATDGSSSTGPNGRPPSSDADIRARLIADWNLDSIVCGVSSFDQDHILVLAYMPPEDLNQEAEHVERKSAGKARPWPPHTMCMYIYVDL